jgi:thioredoxin 1
MQMPDPRPYATQAPTREALQALPGLTLLEFGAGWCGHCAAAEPFIAAALAGRDELHHVKVEDGPGRPLGRAYRVRLWPTLILLRDGMEVGRVVRPASGEVLDQLLASALPASAP